MNISFHYWKKPHTEHWTGICSQEEEKIIFKSKIMNSFIFVWCSTVSGNSSRKNIKQKGNKLISPIMGPRASVHFHFIIIFWFNWQLWWSKSYSFEVFRISLQRKTQRNSQQQKNYKYIINFSGCYCFDLWIILCFFCESFSKREYVVNENEYEFDWDHLFIRYFIMHNWHAESRLQCNFLPAIP